MQWRRNGGGGRECKVREGRSRTLGRATEWEKKLKKKYPKTESVDELFVFQNEIHTNIGLNTGKDQVCSSTYLPLEDVRHQAALSFCRRFAADSTSLLSGEGRKRAVSVLSGSPQRRNFDIDPREISILSQICERRMRASTSGQKKRTRTKPSRSNRKSPRG